ncbi:hypothetical protein SDC9_203039 [bioreactor metagenome]|uniref:Uncharacterized protein n=1 Tax=bioreactor metagenome TaxID=1076179 RepID=A0A645IW48_9ZZZZ
MKSNDKEKGGAKMKKSKILVLKILYKHFSSAYFKMCINKKWLPDSNHFIIISLNFRKFPGGPEFSHQHFRCFGIVYNHLFIRIPLNGLFRCHGNFAQ